MRTVPNIIPKGGENLEGDDENVCAINHIPFIQLVARSKVKVVPVLLIICLY